MTYHLHFVYEYLVYDMYMYTTWYSIIVRKE